VDQELDDELRYHLERQIEENLALGIPSEEARFAALRAMGGLQQRREECRDARGWRWLHDLAGDARFALRSFSRSPSFTAVAVASLALGIGVNTAIFSAVNALLLEPLPYPHPDRLVWIDEEQVLPAVDFVDWSEHSQTLEAIAAYTVDDLTLTGVGEPERVAGFHVSESLFPTLGASMLLGRNFLPAEEREGGEHVAILSHGLWQRRFGSDPGVLGRTIRINDDTFRLIGVLRPEFRFFGRSELWLPLAMDYAQLRRGPDAHGQVHVLAMDGVVARLKPDVAPQKAATELETIRNTYAAPHLKRAISSGVRLGQVRVTPLHDHLLGGTPSLLHILLGAVVLILLIATANVANLMLVRAVVRHNELAIRATLGAGRLRLLRQMLTESLLLAVGGGACGLCVAWCVTRLLTTLGPPDTFGQVARVATINIDGRVLSFTLVVSLLSGLLLGLAPALQFFRTDLTTSLREGGRGRLSRRHRTRQALLIGQVTLAVVLLIGAGLLIRSFVNLLRVEPGFSTENVFTLRISLPWLRYRDPARRTQLQQELVRCIAALPGIERVGAVNHLPLTDFTNMAFSLGGEGSAAEGAPTPIGSVSPDYFHALGIPLRSGRVFDERDAFDAPPVAILSQSLARRLFPNEDPLGKRLVGCCDALPTGPDHPGPTVVGIVDDVRHQGLDRDIKAEVYVPYPQNPPFPMILAVRAAVEPRGLEAAVRSQVLSIDGDLAVYDVMTMEERLNNSVAPRRFTLVLLGGFAFLALVLASVGVYGVSAYLVTQRTHEVGIRMALGAPRSGVLWLFIKQGLALVLCGVALGLLGAWGLSRVIASLLFGITATNPLTFGTAATLMTLVALLACWLPARRATRIDPFVALRHE